MFRYHHAMRLLALIVQKYLSNVFERNLCLLHLLRLLWCSFVPRWSIRLASFRHCTKYCSTLCCLYIVLNDVIYKVRVIIFIASFRFTLAVYALNPGENYPTRFKRYLFLLWLSDENSACWANCCICCRVEASLLESEWYTLHARCHLLLITLWGVGGWWKDVMIPVVLLHQCIISSLLLI